MHVSVCLCMCACMCLCMCLHASVHNSMHSQKVAAAVTALKQIQHIGKGGGRKWQDSRQRAKHAIKLGVSP